MSAAPKMLAAFEHWRLAELAGYFAQPCPDDLMDALVARSMEAEKALGAVPPSSAEDLALQIFPLLLAIHEPKLGGRPMVPDFSDSRLGGEYSEILWRTLVGHLPGFASAMATAADAEVNEYCKRRAA